MAGTETDLANAALDMVGEDEVNNIDDPDNLRAKQVKRLYRTVTRDAVLRAYDWNCVRTQQALVSITNPRSQEWGYAYDLPNDPFCLAARRIVSFNAAPYAGRFEPILIPFEIIGRSILTDESSAVLIYTYREDNPGMYDAGLFDAQVTRLAAQIAFSIVRNFKRGTDLMVEYEKFKAAEAAGVNEAEGVGGKTMYTPQTILTVRRV